MKMWVLLLALAVFTNSQRPLPIFEKIEMQSASDTIVTELLETTFCVPTKLAKEIGHIFRNVPLNLVKEMAAFIVKVFGDSSLNHLDSFSQNTVQAAHIFRQVLEHIDVNKVVAILLPIWTKIIVKFDTLRLLVQVYFYNKLFQVVFLNVF